MVAPLPPLPTCTQSLPQIPGIGKNVPPPTRRACTRRVAVTLPAPSSAWPTAVMNRFWIGACETTNGGNPVQVSAPPAEMSGVIQYVNRLCGDACTFAASVETYGPQ